MMIRRLVVTVMILVLLSLGLTYGLNQPATRALRPLSKSGAAPPPLRSARASPSLDDILLSADFENAPLGGLPAGWIALDLDSGYSSWFGDSSRWQVLSRPDFDAHSGSRFVYCHFNDNARPNDDWLILPSITAGAPITLSYWVASQDESYPESFEVRVSTAGTLPATFTNLIHSETQAPAVWTEYSHDLSAFAGAPFWIAFHYNSVDRFALKLDDLQVEGIGPPTGLVAGTVSDDSARPIVQATARVLQLQREVRTDALGAYLISAVPSGNYTLAFSHEFFHSTSRANIAVAIGETTWVNVSLEPLPLRITRYSSTFDPRPISDFDTTHMNATVADTALVYDVEVTVNLLHTYVGDLDLWLRSPDSVWVQLVAHDPLDNGQNILDCTFDDEAALPFAAGQAPFTGYWRPWQPLSAFDGDSTIAIRSGHLRTTWVLYVYDGSAGDGGQLLGFTLQLATQSIPADGLRPEPVPLESGFDGNFPNPCNAATTFRFHLARSSLVRLEVYDLLGRRVAELLNEDLPPGSHLAHFDTSHLSSGVYLARLKTPDMTRTHKVVVLK